MIYQYVKSHTGKVHLRRSGRHFPWASMTLCGWPVRPFWDLGDETIIGLATTCKSCDRILLSERTKEAERRKGAKIHNTNKR